MTMTTAEAIGILTDRAERWAEFHEPDELDCEGYEADDSDDPNYYGHPSCEETRQLDEALEVVRPLVMGSAAA